jgi:hypothetical protein
MIRDARSHEIKICISLGKSYANYKNCILRKDIEYLDRSVTLCFHLFGIRILKYAASDFIFAPLPFRILQNVSRSEIFGKLQDESSLLLQSKPFAVLDRP